MGQYFRVHNIDNATPVKTSMAGKWSEDFWANGNDSDFMRALWSIPEGQKRVVVKPYPSGQSVPKKDRIPLPRPFKNRPSPALKYPKESHANLNGNGILRLSNELIVSIFAHLDEKDDIVYLAMSCQRLFSIASFFLEQAFQNTFIRSWAGDRLICLGDESDISKLPYGILTEREVKFLEDQNSPYEDKKSYDEEDEDSKDIFDEDIYEDSEKDIYDYLAPLWTLNPNFKSQYLMRQDGRWTEYPRDFREYCLDLQYRGQHWQKSGGHCHLWEFSGDIDVLRDLVQVDACNPRYEDLYTSNSPYIFRNLTTREYVRGNAVFNLRQEEKYFDYLCFEHLFYLRATWSSNPDLRHGYWGPIKLHQGRWAGHRFDLTAIDNLKGEEWKDISNEILEELQEVFDDYY